MQTVFSFYLSLVITSPKCSRNLWSQYSHAQHSSTTVSCVFISFLASEMNKPTQIHYVQTTHAVLLSSAPCHTADRLYAFSYLIILSPTADPLELNLYL